MRLDPTLATTAPGGGGRQSLEPPEPDLQPAELVERAIQLRPLLRELQGEVEDNAGIPATLHERFVECGFYRILQPRRFGGYEFDPRCYADVVRELARGCPSSAWNLCLAASHALLVGSLFDERAQSELFGTGDFRAPLPVAPTGTATRSRSGYVVNGRWDYASGVNVSTIFLAGALVDDGDGHPHPGVIAVPDGWTMLDNWGHVLGMRGSGSNSVVVDGVEIPHRYVYHGDLRDLDVSGGTPGSRLHGNPMYAGRMMSFFNIQLVSIAVGTAWATIDEYEHLITTKQTPIPPFILRAEDPEYQRVFGRAHALVEAAQRIITSIADDYLVIATRGIETDEPFSLLDDDRLSVTAREAGQMAAAAVEMLVQTAGSSPLADGQRMQRYLRDTWMYKSHLNAQHDRLAAVYARELLGHEP